jgi:hypothetical protein
MTSVNYLIKEISAVLGAIKTEPMQDLLLVDAINKAKEMHKVEQESLYTEEQVRDIVLKFAEERTFLRQGIAIRWVKNYFQSLKQPKKD